MASRVHSERQAGSQWRGISNVYGSKELIANGCAMDDEISKDMREVWCEGGWMRVIYIKKLVKILVTKNITADELLFFGLALVWLRTEL